MTPPPLRPCPLGELVALLRTADPAFQVFGSAAHRYRLAPPLPEADLAAFEAAHGVRLPEDYRAHLRGVGNGGAGPYYGLVPLRAFGGPLAAPFPFDEATDLGGDDDPGPDDLPGLVELADQGCAMSSCLVVSGPQRGAVWTYAVGVYRQADSFDARFRGWAEEKLRLVARAPLAARLRPGMTLAEAKAATGTPWRVRRDEPPLAFGDGPPYRLAFTNDVRATVRVDEAGTILHVEPLPFL